MSGIDVVHGVSEQNRLASSTMPDRVGVLSSRTTVGGRSLLMS
jgi:hypothetical protein